MLLEVVRFYFGIGVLFLFVNTYIIEEYFWVTSMKIGRSLMIIILWCIVNMISWPVVFGGLVISVGIKTLIRKCQRKESK